MGPIHKQAFDLDPSEVLFFLNQRGCRWVCSAKEKQLYSYLRPDVWAPHPIMAKPTIET